MRELTPKDIEATAYSFMYFIKTMNGERYASKTLVPLVSKALSEGVTLDELFNKENYSRAGAVTPKPTAEQFIDILSSRSIEVKSLKDEELWDDKYNIELIAEIFHNFYVRIKPDGGTYRTGNAIKNLKNVIKTYGIQPILSEKLITDFQLDTNIEKEKTCYQYIRAILNGNLSPDTTLTESQHFRLAENMALATVAEMENEPENAEKVTTESAFNGDDKDIFKEILESVKTEDPFYECPKDIQEETDEIVEADESENNESSFVFNPKFFKREKIEAIINALSPESIFALSKCIKDKDKYSNTLEGLVDALTEGSISIDTDDLVAKNAMELMNEELKKDFIECAGRLGIQLNESSLLNRYILLEDWDMRDRNIRKLNKIKFLVFTKGDDDIDLKEAIQDLEKLYESERLQ